MDHREAIYSRRSVRDYTSDPVSHDALRALIDAAIQAPSAMNEQTWAFCVIESQPLLDRISTASKTYMLEAPVARDAPAHFKAMLTNPAFHIFYHAPALIVICSTKQDQWALENCALAAENLMLAACGAGLGSCWIGFAQAWLGTDEGRAALQIPESWLPVAPIIIGHPKSPSSIVPRRAPDVRWIGS